MANFKGNRRKVTLGSVFVPEQGDIVVRPMGEDIASTVAFALKI